MRKSLNPMIYLLYDNVSHLSFNRYLVDSSGLYGVIDHKGKIIIPIEYVRILKNKGCILGIMYMKHKIGMSAIYYNRRGKVIGYLGLDKDGKRY